MRLSSIFIMFLIVTFSATAQGRKPAVEDFVGVETENYKKTPTGAEVLFNFGNHITNNKPNVSQTGNNWFSLATLLAFISLPFLMWFSINTSIKNQENTALTQVPPTQVNASSNVESLDKYRETNKSASEEESKKAS